ncbi:MAG: O-methyltransferase, partial [Ignavibacteriaceae bacterium]
LFMKEILYPEQMNYLESFNKEDDALILEMEDFARKNSVPILSRDSAKLMEILIKMKRPKRVLELGTAIAYTTIRIARNLKKEAVIHTIEFSKDNAKLSEENIKKSGVEEKIKLFFGDAKEVMPTLEKKYDFIYLDADKEDYLDLFELAMKLLKKKGVIFVDNLLWHGYAASDDVPEKYKTSTKFIREFNKIFTNYPGLNTTIIPVGDGIGLGVRKNA